jgi:hypothetical protein
MSYSLYLDDQHNAGPHYPQYDVWVKNTREMLMAFEWRGYPNQISLDHNLGDNLTGMEALRLLLLLDMEDNFINADFKMLMHSGHPDRRQEMCDVYNEYVSKKGGNLHTAYTEYF